MPVSDKIQQLEAQIRRRIEQSFGEMRQEILDRFRTQNERLREQLEELSSALPEGLFRESDLQPVLDEVSAEAEQREAEKGRDVAVSMAGVTETLTVFDRARSQSELLQALFGQCGRFASRVAVFLAQPGRFKGWGGHGLGDAEAALRELEIEAKEGSVWARLLEGRGVVRLSSAERAELSSRLEIPVPREAILVPLVLRDRVAAAVYADRVGEDGDLPVPSLQALTYMTALAIETLPVRKRESTATLQMAEPEPTPPAPEEAPAEAPAFEAAPEAAEAAAPPAAPEALAAPEPPVEEPVGEEPAAPAPSAPPSAAPEPEAGGELEVAPEAMEEVDVGEMELGEMDLEAEEEISLEDFSAEPETPAEPAPPPEPPTAPPVEAPAGPPAETLAPDTGGGELSEDTHPGIEPTPPPGQPLGAGSGGGAEVAPPSDVQGPGWAFSSGEEMDGDEEARHEEARRLARLLVSEIKLYNEEQVMEGRQSNDIFERLKEDIERSRQLYDARVDERVREKTDYFYQEMVRVLGAGDPKALGI